MKTILIADDNEDLREMLSHLLGVNGYRVLEAASGQDAADIAVRERPDLVLMDLGLPGKDGLSAVAEIRESIPPDQMPILIVSAYDRLEYRTEAISAGCSGFVAKPVDNGALLRTIRFLLGEDRSIIE